MASKAMLVVGGAAVLGLGYLLVRRSGELEPAKPEPADPCEALREAGASEAAVVACRVARTATGADDPCELLRIMGAGAERVELCKATKAVVGGVVDIANQLVDALLPQVKQADILKKNTAKNGPVVEADVLGIAAHAHAHQGLIWYSVLKDQAPEIWTALHDYPIPRHENGCVPCQGVWLSASVGHHKCAPGTFSYVRMSDRIASREAVVGDRVTVDKTAFGKSYSGVWNFGPPRVSEDNPSYPLVSKDARRAVSDPLTHPHYYWTQNNSDDNKFPLPVPTGMVPWWVCGQPQLAPQGTVPSKISWEQRQGLRLFASVEFAPPEERVVSPPPAAPPGTAQPGVGEVVEDPRGVGGLRDGDVSLDGSLVWRTNPVGHWERRRARDG